MAVSNSISEEEWVEWARIAQSADLDDQTPAVGPTSPPGEVTTIAWDTETTGLSVSARLVSIAMVCFDADSNVTSTYHEIIRPERDVYFTPQSVAIHGISRQRASSEGLPFDEVFERICEIVHAAGSGVTLVGHNASFDRMVLQRELACRGISTSRTGFDFINAKDGSHSFECTLKLARLLKVMPNNKKGNYTLSTLHTELLHETFDGAHDALNDAKAAGRLFHRLRAMQHQRSVEARQRFPAIKRKIEG